MKDDPKNFSWEAKGEQVKIVINGGLGTYRMPDDSIVQSLTVELPHQCDAWEIADGTTGNVIMVKAELDDFIRDLIDARRFMDSLEFADKITEVNEAANGG